MGEDKFAGDESCWLATLLQGHVEHKCVDLSRASVLSMSRLRYV